ncbi:MAG: nucleotide exchange factor GrpE [Gammaproteobacteria bacterium]|nr:nucleotide exchange factor GrpE [Gammaproteobacteria bacterium]
MNHDVPGDEPAAAPTAEKAEAQESEHTEVAPDAEVDEEPLSELECAQREAAENRDNYLRVAAEIENLRKRGARELENARKYGLERLAQALLPVRDSLEAGVAAADDSDAADNTDVESLREGKRATLRLLDAALEQAGVAEFDPEGEPFDPARHEAMTMQPSATAEPNTVLTVIQKGYLIHDRLLRPARVIVSEAPAAEGDD